MPRSRLLLDLFQHDARLSAEEQSLLAAWFERTHEKGEDLPTLLVRLGYLTPTASRTLDLMAKGFVARDSRTVVPDDVLRRIQEEILQPALAEAGPTHPRRVVESGITRANEALHASGCETSHGTQHPLPGSTIVIQHPKLRPPAVGDILGKCLLTGVLGRGGHGMVFSALHQSLNISVAVKVLLSDGSPIDEKVRRQLRREAQLLARLNHQNVTRVLDYDDTGVPYVVMELVEGPSLADLIAMSGRIDVARAAEIFTHAAEGLRAGDEVGLVHRDVKPGNILLARNGMAKVADLGLALATTDPSRQKVDSAGLVGTCAYGAPEQARSASEVDFRADIYSLGATFYHAVTGRMPFEGRSGREMLLKHATQPVTPPSEVTAGIVDEATSSVIVRMMAKDPADRYLSYDALLNDLRGLVHGQLPPKASTPTAIATVTRSGILGRIFQYRSKPDA